MEKQISILHQACTQLGLATQFIDRHQNVMQVNFPAGQEYFRINRTPFNSEVVTELCRDKMHTYELLGSHINMPLTRSYLDVNIDSQYQHYLEYPSLSAVLTDVQKHFSYPLVVKKNAGALGVGVYLCTSAEEAYAAFQAIFNKQSSEYDYLALAQQYLHSKKEYRLVCAFGEPVLLYQRGQTTGFNARYWDNQEVAINIADQSMIDTLMEFVRPVYQHLNLGFAGFDIIEDETGTFYLIEINSSPKFSHFLDNNSPQWILDMYIKTLNLFIQQDIV